MTLKLYYSYLLTCLACATCMATSCSSESSDIPEVLEGCEVAFDVKDLTRATVTTTFDQFVVYGDMKYTKDSNAEPTIIFNKTLVERSNDSWRYEGTQYWFADHEHSFVGIYPLSVLEPANDPQYSDSKLSFTYTLPMSEEGLVSDKDVADIVAATCRRVYSESSSVSKVSLRFSHLLSQINFLVELTEPSTRSEESLKIHKLEMSGFGTSAIINIKPAPRLDNPETADREIDIVTAKDDGSLEISFDEPVEVINGDGAIKMFDGDDALIMLPQTFASDDKLQIRLTYSVNNEEEPTVVSATLSSFTWEWGKSYNYKIKLELEQKEVNMVISEATIVPWNLVDDHDEVDAK